MYLHWLTEVILCAAHSNWLCSRGTGWKNTGKIAITTSSTVWSYSYADLVIRHLRVKSLLELTLNIALLKLWIMNFRDWSVIGLSLDDEFWWRSILTALSMMCIMVRFKRWFSWKLVRTACLDRGICRFTLIKKPMLLLYLHWSDAFCGSLPIDQNYWKNAFEYHRDEVYKSSLVKNYQ